METYIDKATRVRCAIVAVETTPHKHVHVVCKSSLTWFDSGT